MHHRPRTRAGRRRTAVATVLLASVLLAGLLGAPQAVSASWLQSGTGPGAAGGTAVPALSQRPTSNRPFLSNTVTVSWTTVTVRGAAVSGYVVTRYDGNGAVSPIPTGTCVGTLRNTVPNVVTTLSCTDERGLNGGTFTYRVRPVLERWYGPFSDLTTPAV